MVKTYIVKKGQKPTEEQIRAIKEAKKHPITFDKDCEELSPAMQKAFRCAVIQRNRRIHCIVLLSYCLCSYRSAVYGNAY